MQRKKLSHPGLALRKLAGAPTKYLPEYADLVLKLRMLGISDKHIAECMNISISTVYDWINAHTAFACAWRQGGRIADANVAHSLYRRAMGWEHRATKLQYNAKADKWASKDYIERYPGEVQAQALWLSNKQPALWKSARSVTENIGDVQQLPPVIVVEGVWSREQLTIEGHAE